MNQSWEHIGSRERYDCAASTRRGFCMICKLDGPRKELDGIDVTLSPDETNSKFWAPPRPHFTFPCQTSSEAALLSPQG